VRCREGAAGLARQLSSNFPVSANRQVPWLGQRLEPEAVLVAILKLRDLKIEQNSVGYRNRRLSRFSGTRTL
jgi:hypothetical protein